MRTYWSGKDIEYMKLHYSTTENKNLGIILNRTPVAIAIKAKKLGLKKNPETTSKLKSKNMSGEKNPMYGKVGFNKGKVVSESTREKLRVSMTGRLGMVGDKNPMYGKPSYNKGIKITEEERVKTSLRMKEKWLSFNETEKNIKLNQLANARSMVPNIFNLNSIEKKINNYLEDIGVSFESQKKIGFYHCDFYLPFYNLIIEVQGDYWHGNPDKFTNLNEVQTKNIRRDKAKKTYLINKNYKLLYIWECDINTNFELVKEMITKVTQ